MRSNDTYLYQSLEVSDFDKQQRIDSVLAKSAGLRLPSIYIFKCGCFATEHLKVLGEPNIGYQSLSDTGTGAANSMLLAAATTLFGQYWVITDQNIYIYIGGITHIISRQNADKLERLFASKDRGNWSKNNNANGSFEGIVI